MLQPNQIEQWIFSFPKLLWQLKSTNLKLSSTLITISQRTIKTLPSDILPQLERIYIPMFYTEIPVGPNDKKIVFGPFIEYVDVSMQNSVLSLLFEFANLSSAMQKAILKCIPYMPESCIIFLIELLSYSQTNGSPKLTKKNLTSFLMTIFAATAITKKWNETTQIVHAVVTALVDNGFQNIHEIEPLLIEILDSNTVKNKIWLNFILFTNQQFDKNL